MSAFALSACGGGATRAVPAGAKPVQMETARSVSPASIAAPPMARTAVQPASQMSALTPKASIVPPSWTQLPGGAIAVTASPDGSIWVLSSAGSGPDRSIWHYAGGSWTNIPGAAMRLAAAPDNSLWVVNSAGGIYHYAGGAWSTIAGGASDITVAADNSVYVISNQAGGQYGRGIWHYAGGAWTQMPGQAVRIAASADPGTYPPNIAPGGFYVVNSVNSIYYYNPSSGFAQLPGGVVLVAPATTGGIFALGYIQNGDGSFPIYYNDLSAGSWSLEPGAAVSLAANATNVYAVGAAGGIYSSPITLGTPAPVPTSTPVASCTAPSSAGDRATAGTLRRFAPRAHGGIVPNQLYVRYKAGSDTRSVARAERAASIARATDILTSRGLARGITLAAGVDAASAAAALRRDPSVLDVSPVHVRTLNSDTAHGANDTFFTDTYQWYLYKTNTVKNGGSGAWDLTTGSSAVSVAMIDTGVDLTGPRLGGHDFTLDYAESVVDGVRSVGAACAQDTNGHGTNTAGLAVALANDTYGFAGAGYSTHLQAYRIFPDTTANNLEPSASTLDEVTAINDAVAHGASVISLSIGSPQSDGADAAESDAVANAIAHNVVVVAAAGNESDAVPDYPAAYPGVIAVGASAVGAHSPNVYSSITSETIASYSNSGPTLVAPGADPPDGADGSDRLVWIPGYFTTTSGDPNFKCSNSGSPPVCAVLYAGTSQATPQVAGAVALMEAYHGGPRSLSAAQAKAILTSTADVLPGITTDRQGAGRLNAGRAVAAAHP